MSAPAFQTRGSCPSVWAPMESGDGFLVRVRAPGGALRWQQAQRLATLAARYGNGQLELTRRGNLQLRGVPLAQLEPLQAQLRAHGLAAASRKAEQRQLMVLDPLAGLWPGSMPVAALAERLEAQLLTAEWPAELPAKFVIALEGGGAPLDVAADLRIVLLDAQHAQLSLATPHGEQVLGGCAVAELETALSVLLGLARLPRPVRMRERVAELGFEVLRARLTSELSLSAAQPSAARKVWRAEQLVGAHPDSCLVALALPFGAADAALWQALSQLAPRHGAQVLRLTPWRMVLLVGVSSAAMPALCAQAEELGFITRADDPLLRVTACPGAPACAAAQGETRQLARALARELAGPLGAGATLHVSGCAKGCAGSQASHFTWLHAPQGVQLGRHVSVREAAALPCVSEERARQQLAQLAHSSQTASQERAPHGDADEP